MVVECTNNVEPIEGESDELTVFEYHEVLDSRASEGSEVACTCFGTHTGLIGLCGPYYSAHETADNLADEVSVGHVSYTEAITSLDNGTCAADDG